MIRLRGFINFFIFDTSLSSFKAQAMFGPAIRYRLWDLLISIFIIGILSMIAIKIFTGYKIQAVVLHGLGDEMQLRVKSQVYHSITGSWPDDESGLEAVTGFPNQDLKPDKFSYIDSIHLERGAVHYLFRRDIEGKTVTLRAAVPKEDSMGPVIWIAGDGMSRDDWTIFGENKTTVDPWVINRFLK